MDVRTKGARVHKPLSFRPPWLDVDDISRLLSLATALSDLYRSMTVWQTFPDSIWRFTACSRNKTSIVVFSRVVLHCPKGRRRAYSYCILVVEATILLRQHGPIMYNSTHSPGLRTTVGCPDGSKLAPETRSHDGRAARSR